MPNLLHRTQGFFLAPKVGSSRLRPGPEFIPEERDDIEQVGVTDLVLGTEQGARPDLSVEGSRRRGKAAEVGLHAVPVEADVLLPPESLGRSQECLRVEGARNPEEATAQCEVHLLDRLVDQVHRSDDVKVPRDVQSHRLALLVASRQLDDLIPVLEQREALAKHSAQVGAIDLVQNKNVRQPRIGLRLLDLADQFREKSAPVLRGAALRDV